MRETIVIVDSSALTLAVAEHAFSELYDVIGIQTASDVFILLETIKPSIMLIDSAMPDMDTLELIKTLKKHASYKAIPIVLLTSSHNDNAIIKGLEIGVADFITKPFSAPILLARIQAHINTDKLIKSRTQDLQQALISLDNMHRNLLFILADIVETRDNNADRGHIERTIRYAEALISKMIEEEVYKEEIYTWDLSNINASISLHDIGKIGISDVILNKPDKLSPEEYEIMKEHANIGAILIDRVIDKSGGDNFLYEAKVFAQTHHENWDGSGYPQGLAGENIPLQGRVMAIVDVYDVLVTDKPYKKAFTPEFAFETIIAEAGTKFDPKIVEVFAKLREEFEEIQREFE